MSCRVRFNALAICLRLFCGIRQIRADQLPSSPIVFFANHSSHLDFALIWASLPADHRAMTRPVAGRDYWEKTAARRWLAKEVFRAVLIERQRVTVSTNPLEAMVRALDAGGSLIVFPEGTRSRDGQVHEFKSGLYHLARSRPLVPFIPIHLENLNRILPKGDFLAVPLIAAISAGAPLRLMEDELKADFLKRSREAILQMA